MEEKVQITDIEFKTTHVEVKINGKQYFYRFGDGYTLNSSLWKTYWNTFGRNKGRFLAKIRDFRVEKINDTNS